MWPIPAFSDYTTPWHHLHRETPEGKLPRFTDLELASDGSGLRTTHAGEYRIFRYGDPGARQRKHLVVVITADVRHKKVIGIEAHIEGKGHSEAGVAIQPIRKAAARKCRVRSLRGDGAYDARAVFEGLKEVGAEPAVKVARNAPGNRRHTSCRGPTEGGTGVSKARVSGAGGEEGLEDEMSGRRGNLLGGEAYVGREHAWCRGRREGWWRKGNNGRGGIR